MLCNLTDSACAQPRHRHMRVIQAYKHVGRWKQAGKPGLWRIGQIFTVLLNNSPMTVVVPALTLAAEYRSLCGFKQIPCAKQTFSRAPSHQHPNTRS